MSKKILAVFGATGRQGSSIINHVLTTPSLSSQYTVRALTRDITSPTAQALSVRGVQLAVADVDDPSTLVPAVSGAHTVVAITITNYDSNTYDHETANGKAIADAAVAAGAHYIIFSTLPSALAISGGKYKVDGFDAKLDIERHIRGLPIKSAFYTPGFFMENLTGPLKPQRTGEGKFTLANLNTSDVVMPLIATKRDVGKFVGLILEDQEAYETKTVNVAIGDVSWADIAQVMSKVTGKEVEYQQVPAEVYASFFGNEHQAVNYGNMFKLFQDFSYYGGKVEAPERLKSQVADFETFLKEEEFALE